MGITEGFASDSFRKKSRFSCLEIRKNPRKQVFDYKKLTFLTIILFKQLGKSLKNAIFAKGQLDRPMGKMEYKETKRRRSECLECGQPIHYGRTDKKFCSETCKNKYHNEQTNQYLKMHSKIIHILDKNHRILAHCLSNGLTSVSLGDAIQWGFNPDFVTGVDRARLRTEYRCFDIIYLKSDTLLYNIRQQKDAP